MQHAQDENINDPLSEQPSTPSIPPVLPYPWIQDDQGGVPSYVNAETVQITLDRSETGSVARVTNPVDAAAPSPSSGPGSSSDHNRLRVSAPNAALPPAGSYVQVHNGWGFGGFALPGNPRVGGLHSAPAFASVASRVGAQPYMPAPTQHQPAPSRHFEQYRLFGQPMAPFAGSFSGGAVTAANRTEFLIAFGSSLPGIADSNKMVSRLKWSVHQVRMFMDSPNLSRFSVISEILSVKREDVRSCFPVELADIIRSHGDDMSPLIVAHSLQREQIVNWYASVVAVVGTQAIGPRILCPAKRTCQIVPFSSGKPICSVCAQIIYLGSSVARSYVSDFCVCEVCCRNPAVCEKLSNTPQDSPDLNFPGVSFRSNAASDLLEFLLQPRSFLPAADNFADNNWHIAMDIWMRVLRDVAPSPSRNDARPRHLSSLEDRVTAFKRRVPEPQFHFRVSGIDQANVCEAMQQIFERRANINLKLSDARQASIDDSKLTVLFRSAKAGQAAGMPANIHSDGITPVMYSILASEFSTPTKFAAEMWLPSCFIDGNPAPCGLFPRPFIPDTTPSELQLQKETVERYLLLGRCIGIALRDRRVFMLPMSLAMADALCGKKLSLWDTCLGEIQLQENDDLSINNSHLHALEHCLDDVCFSMVYRGRTLSNQRVDIPISEASFGSSEHCSMHNVQATIKADDHGDLYIHVPSEALQHVQDASIDGDLVYVMFAGVLPRGLSVYRAYSVEPVKDASHPRLKLSVDAAGSPVHLESQSCEVSMHVMRVYSSEDRAGHKYLRALEVCAPLCSQPLSYNLVLQRYCLRSGIQMQIDAARRGIEEFVPLSRLEVLLFSAGIVMFGSAPHADPLQDLCGDGLLEALGVTTNGERGISDEAWADFVNNVSSDTCHVMLALTTFRCLTLHTQGVHTGTDADSRDCVAADDMAIFRKALLMSSAPDAKETAKRWPSMKQDFCRWLFAYPRLPRVPRLKVVRSRVFFGHTCAPAELQLPPLQHAPPFVPPYRFISSESRSKHHDPVAALLESLEVYCKDAIHPGNPMSE